MAYGLHANTAMGTITIINGTIPSYGTLLAYAVRDNGVRVSIEFYRGAGELMPEGKLFIGDKFADAALYEYSVDTEPTSSSKERWKGYLHAWRAQRMRCSNVWTDDFRSGWDTGREDRRNKDNRFDLDLGKLRENWTGPTGKRLEL